MNFSQEQIMESNNYREVCEQMLSLTKDETILKKLKSILYDGQIDSYNIKSKFDCLDNPVIERNRRISMASVLIRNPETFNFFKQNNINVFHGTNANALPGILKYGINSQKNLRSKGVPILTGEGIYERNFISFTDVLDIAENYSSLFSENGNENLEFNVVIGISEFEMDKARRIRVTSDISEIDVSKYFPLESISCICVPDDKVTLVKKMVSDCQIPVLGMSDLNKKAFYIDVDAWNRITLFPELYETPKNNKKFSIYEIKKIAESRSLIKMKKFIEKIKNVFMKTEEDEIGRKFK